MNELYECIKAKSGKKLPLSSDVHLSAEMKLLLRGFLQMDPEKRISWNEFFNHQIFKKNSPQRKNRERAQRIQSEQVIQNSRVPLETVYAFDKLGRRNQDKHSSRGAQLEVFSTRDIFANAKKNQKRHASNKQKSIQSKFHSHKNTPKVRHDKNTFGTRKDLSTERLSTYSFLTGNPNYTETSITRRNLFERATNRREGSPDVSPWEQPRTEKQCSIHSWTRNRPPASTSRRNKMARAKSPEGKKDTGHSRKLEFGSKEVPAKVNRASGLDQIEKSYIPMKEVVARMSNRHKAQENLYFFCHEINKVLFLMRVARDSLDFLSRTDQTRARRSTRTRKCS